MASAVVAATKPGAYLPSSPPRSRSMAGRSKSVGGGRRRRRGCSNREKGVEVFVSRGLGGGLGIPDLFLGF